ncbi:hypothetical protein CYY_001991 [Polysphondylium violaceum]|uniref:Uncharacterized protein n=1 Tax=Polysphondylium violaceum TaxID=133409 RepID=A0A8J4Q2D4_9MYCE|nr:hypothetical protein CYY_001991 [Polysphondylium violaceum]
MKLNEAEFIESLNVEYTIKKCTSTPLINNFKQMFPNDLSEIKVQTDDDTIDENNNNTLYMIISWIPTKLPMSGFSSATEDEREEKSLMFIQNATKICKYIQEKNYWCDFIDPLTGVPHIKRENANSVFVPTESVPYMNIEIIDVGCCQVMVHPKFKVRSFFSVIVSTAPFKILDEAIHATDQN